MITAVSCSPISKISFSSASKKNDAPQRDNKDFFKNSDAVSSYSPIFLNLLKKMNIAVKPANSTREILSRNLNNIPECKPVYNHDGKPFSGSMIRPVDGKKYVIRYVDGYVSDTYIGDKLYKTYSQYGNLSRDKGVTIAEYDDSPNKILKLSNIVFGPNGKISTIYADNSQEAVYYKNALVSKKISKDASGKFKRIELYDSQGRMSQKTVEKAVDGKIFGITEIYNYGNSSNVQSVKRAKSVLYKKNVSTYKLILVDNSLVLHNYDDDSDTILKVNQDGEHYLYNPKLSISYLVNGDKKPTKIGIEQDGKILYINGEQTHDFPKIINSARTAIRDGQKYLKTGFSYCEATDVINKI